MKQKRNVSEDRRKLLKGMATLPLIGGLSMVSTSARESLRDRGYLSEEAMASLQNLQGTMPKGKLGKYEISRLVMGCNPMGGWSHSRDLRYVGTLSQKWHTPVKMKETWAIGEKAGLNLCNLVAQQYATFNEYKKETGSKMMNMCQCSIGPVDDRLAPLKQAVDNGADFIYIQGENTDGLAQSNALDALFQALEFTHSQGLLFGVGSHSLQTILNSIKLGVKPDFYYKTFHHDNYWSATPRERRVEYPQRAMNFSRPAASTGTPATGAPQPGAAVTPATGTPQPGATASRTQGTQILAGSKDAPRVDHDAYNDNMWDQFPEQTIEAFKSIEVPMFGFKVMAAGAITPADGIRWAFENGADFVCAGMYDFQIVDDVNTTIQILNSLGPRQRPWRA